MRGNVFLKGTNFFNDLTVEGTMFYLGVKGTYSLPPTESFDLGSFPHDCNVHFENDVYLGDEGYIIVLGVSSYCSTVVLGESSETLRHRAWSTLSLFILCMRARQARRHNLRKSQLSALTISSGYPLDSDDQPAFFSALFERGFDHLEPGTILSLRGTSKVSRAIFGWKAIARKQSSRSRIGKSTNPKHVCTSNLRQNYESDSCHSQVEGDRLVIWSKSRRPS